MKPSRSSPRSSRPRSPEVRFSRVTGTVPGTWLDGSRVPAWWEPGERPVGIGPEVLPAGRPRGVGEHALCLSSDLLFVEQPASGRLDEFVLVLPLERPVSPDDQVALLDEPHRAGAPEAAEPKLAEDDVRAAELDDVSSRHRGRV